MLFPRIMVPVKGIKAEAEAIHLACESLEKNGVLYLVHVIEVKRSLPVDARLDEETEAGEEILERAQSVAKELRRQAEAEILQAREAGAAIVEEAAERKVDLIVLAKNYQTQFGEFALGNTIPFVLAHAPCRVWVYREPPFE